MDRVMEQLEREENRLFAKLVYVLNLIDLYLSIHAIRNGATELNPLLQSVPVMVAVKVVGVWVLCWWLSSRPEKLARWGLRICAVWFSAANLWHILNLTAVFAV